MVVNLPPEIISKRLGQNRRRVRLRHEDGMFKAFLADVAQGENRCGEIVFHVVQPGVAGNGVEHAGIGSVRHAESWFCRARWTIGRQPLFCSPLYDAEADYGANTGGTWLLHAGGMGETHGDLARLAAQRIRLAGQD